jgi:hypothetical protein
MGHWAMAIARNIDGSGNSPDKGGQQMKAWLTPDGCFAIISPGSPGGFAFQVIVKFVFLLWSVCTWASACTAHSSVHYLRFTITISYPCVLLFAISVLLYSFSISSSAPSQSAFAIQFSFPISSRFIVSMALVSERLKARCRLFQPVIPPTVLTIISVGGR